MRASERSERIMLREHEVRQEKKESPPPEGDEDKGKAYTFSAIAIAEKMRGMDRVVSTPPDHS